jgi:hypothetical protein
MNIFSTLIPNVSLIELLVLSNVIGAVSLMASMSRSFLSVVLSFPQGRESMVQTALNWRDN